ncbi:Pyruvate:ferredoxin oxidoreductase, gamma subunit [Thermodesulfovibrio sp. N1]|uniref:2-oxoacid:acceptor oxidoreductase family protein n=1 Tax=Thermodesulfovibrio sp. N1 TaxID=1871110 RepID=UPI00083A7AF6|nr:2-oxoacid:acceptor oxidoreductase family protein [Thermodesulfovibrio sp. N1]ODA43747.1 Pyruvate:ferredoxin oxidoreductase, gamma subunit [Thermodesulfovibrio sp. N1]
MEKIEVRWHGRGGQGTVTAAKVFADACLSGGRYVQAFPEYGPERAGAPLRAYNRISSKELRMHCPVSNPDVVVVVDPTLIESIDVTEGAKDNASFIVNSSKDPKELREKLKLKSTQKIYVVDATKIALECFGRPMPNSPMVGALNRVTGLVNLETLLEDVKKSFGKKFAQKIIDGNLLAVKRGYEEVKEG